MDGEIRIDLRPEVLDDVVFWWWIWPGLSGLRPLIVARLDQFNAAEYFARVYQPGCPRGGLGGSYRVLHSAAKRATRRNDRVAFIVHSQMSLWVIASPARLEELFRVAAAVFIPE